MAGPKILISAGEASGDLYAGALAQALRQELPEADFFGCTGPRLREAGVREIVDSVELAVVGLVEVVRHIPRIYGQFRKLVRAVEAERPDLAILTDSPSFHLRLAKKLKRRGVPVVYLVAPQVWAWKRWRVKQIRRDVDKLLCIFPFEEAFFREHGVDAEYIGHPLSRLIGPSCSREEFLAKHGLPGDRPLVVLLPGSRAGEAARHLPVLADAVKKLVAQRAMTFVLATPAGTGLGGRPPSFWEPISRSSIQIIEGETWDAIAHADLALAASGTVTVEAALLGTPTVSFYKVTGLTWWMGRHLVNVPFYSMVNLIAGRQIVPEIMQGEMTGERLAAEANRLLTDDKYRERMEHDLAEVREKLSGEADPIGKAAGVIRRFIIK
jgi:lipid-A-disaccharide synthase